MSFGGDAETQRLSAALVEVESKLSVIMDERDEAKADFETWKEDMQAEMEKRDAAAEKKLEAAFAETREVREELQIAARQARILGPDHRRARERAEDELRAAEAAGELAGGEHGGD